MKSIFTQIGATTIAILILSANVAAASEIVGTLTSSGDTASAASPTTGTIGGSVSGPSIPTVSAGGGGGGGGNGPPVGLLGSNGVAGGVVLGASTISGSNYSVVFPVAEVSPPSSGHTAGTVSVATYAPPRGSVTGTSAMVPNVAPAVVAIDTAMVPITAPLTVTEDPGQLASVMAALGAGDVVTWVWLLLVAALFVAGGTYLYGRYSTEEVARY